MAMHLGRRVYSPLTSFSYPSFRCGISGFPASSKMASVGLRPGFRVSEFKPASLKAWWVRREDRSFKPARARAACGGGAMFGPRDSPVSWIGGEVYDLTR